MTPVSKRESRSLSRTSSFLMCMSTCKLLLLLSSLAAWCVLEAWDQAKQGLNLVRLSVCLTVSLSLVSLPNSPSYFFFQQIFIESASLLCAGDTFQPSVQPYIQPRRQNIHEGAQDSRFSFSLLSLPDGPHGFQPRLCVQQGSREPALDHLGSCQSAANDYPRLYCLQTSGFDCILLSCKICYFVLRSAAVHQKYNSVTNPASS